VKIPILNCQAPEVMSIFIFVALAFTLWLLWKAQRIAREVQLTDLILGPDRKASWSKMAAIIGFVIGSWVIIYLTLHDKLTEMYFLSYFAVCVGSPVAFAMVNRGKNRDDQAGDK
jgi:ABC-type Mn2+/Zn2+ transport system permease subunit